MLRRAGRAATGAVRHPLHQHRRRPRAGRRPCALRTAGARCVHVDAYLVQPGREEHVDEICRLLRAERSLSPAGGRVDAGAAVARVDLRSTQTPAAVASVVEAALAAAAEAVTVSTATSSSSPPRHQVLDVVLGLDDAGDAQQQDNAAAVVDFLIRLEEERARGGASACTLRSTLAVVGNWARAPALRRRVEAATAAASGARRGGTLHSFAERCTGVCVHPPLTVVYGPMFAGKSSRLVDFHAAALAVRAGEGAGVLAGSGPGSGDDPLLRVAVLKPALDNRSAADVVRTHDGRVIGGAVSFAGLDLGRDFLSPGVGANDGGQGQGHVEEEETVPGVPDVFVIDEGHFFGAGELEQFLLDVRAVRPTAAVCVAGLDLDYRREPFEPMRAAMVLPHARLEHLQAACQFFDGVVEADQHEHQHQAERPATAANEEGGGAATAGRGDVCGSAASYSARRVNVNGDTLLVGGAESYLPLCATCYDKYHRAGRGSSSSSSRCRSSSSNETANDDADARATTDRRVARHRAAAAAGGGAKGGASQEEERRVLRQVV